MTRYNNQEAGMCGARNVTGDLYKQGVNNMLNLGFASSCNKPTLLDLIFLSGFQRSRLYTLVPDDRASQSSCGF